MGSRKVTRSEKGHSNTDKSVILSEVKNLFSRPLNF